MTVFLFPFWPQLHFSGETPSSPVNVNDLDILMGYNQGVTWCEVSISPLSSFWAMLFEG